MKRKVINDFSARNSLLNLNYSGGTREEAIQFCQELGDDRTLCPYSAYCPQGPGNHVYSAPAELSGEIWAPMLTNSDDSCKYVMIGQLFNGDTRMTCRTSCSSNKRMMHDSSQYIMCCKH